MDWFSLIYMHHKIFRKYPGGVYFRWLKIYLLWSERIRKFSNFDSVNKLIPLSFSPLTVSSISVPIPRRRHVSKKFNNSFPWLVPKSIGTVFGIFSSISHFYLWLTWTVNLPKINKRVENSPVRQFWRRLIGWMTNARNFQFRSKKPKIIWVVWVQRKWPKILIHWDSSCWQENMDSPWWPKKLGKSKVSPDNFLTNSPYWYDTEWLLVTFWVLASQFTKSNASVLSWMK